MIKDRLTIFVLGALFYEVVMPMACKATETIMSYLQVVQNSHIVTLQEMQAECDAIANGTKQPIGFTVPKEDYE